LPVTIAATASVNPKVKKLPTDLGPNDVLLELTLKLTGQQKVIAEENVCTPLPNALTPMARGALMEAINNAIRWTVRNATIKANQEILEPEFDRPDNPKFCAARTRDEYPQVVPGPCDKDWPTTLEEAKAMSGVPPAAGAKPGTKPDGSSSGTPE